MRHVMESFRYAIEHALGIFTGCCIVLGKLWIVLQDVIVLLDEWIESGSENSVLVFRIEGTVNFWTYLVWTVRIFWTTSANVWVLVVCWRDDPEVADEALLLLAFEAFAELSAVPLIVVVLVVEPPEVDEADAWFSVKFAKFCKSLKFKGIEREVIEGPALAAGVVPNTWIPGTASVPFCWTVILEMPF